MTTERTNMHVHALEDGRVLVIGDDTTAEIWDPATAEWHETASLNNPRTDFASVLLRDGRVLVTGGLNDMEQSYSSAYLFDPATESWEKAAGLMITARTRPSAALLPDGRVLVAGGYFHVAPGSGRSSGGNVLAAHRPDGRSGAGVGPTDVVPGPFGAALATAEIFDPDTGAWSSTGPMRYARHGAAMTPLADGRVLVVGSLGSSNTGVEVAAGAADSAEVYDPATGRFALAGTFPALDLSGPVDAGVAVGGFETYKAGLLIPLSEDGAVLIDHAGYSRHVGTVSRWLRFDADSGAWRDISAPHFTLEDPLSGATYQSPGTTRYEPAVARVADGRVLTAGGTFGDSLASAEVYDPTSDTWTSLPDMPEPRSQGQAVTLGDGSVLVVGGYYFQVDMPISLRSAVRLVFGD